MISEMALFATAAALFGAVLGSFINALSFRFNTGKGMGGRSRCMHCGHTLGILDLVPVLSFIFLRGRCRFCRSRISLQYPLVESAAAGLSLLVYLMYPEPLQFAFWFLVWMTLLFVLVYDIRHKIIPWSCSLLLIVLALLRLAMSSDAGIVDFLAGPLLAAPLFFFSLISRGRWMGWGDGMLELSLGWLLGLSLGLTAFMLAFWIGAVVGIALTTSKTGLTMKSEVPLAPFLVLGAFITLFFHVDLFPTLPYLLRLL